MCWGSNLSHHWSLLSRREETKPKSTSFPSSRVLWSSVQVTTASGENIVFYGILWPGCCWQPHSTRHCNLPCVLYPTSSSSLSSSHASAKAQTELILPIPSHPNRLPFSASQDDEGWHLKTQVSFPVCHMIPLFLSLWNRGSNYKYICFFTVEKLYHHGNI